MYKMVMAMNITDETGYQAYRDAMTPLLTQVGGEFLYDFRVGETLKNASTHPVNRVFVIAFPDEATSKRYFADPAYLEIRARLFDGSVDGYTLIGEVHD